MESEDPLSQLADIHLPYPVSFWPLAPGWWVLIGILVVIAIWMLVLAFRRLLWKKRLEAAQRELDKAIVAYREKLAANAESKAVNQAGLDYLYEVNKVLNRVALYTDAAQSRDIARLSGSAWLAYLDQAYGGNEFSKGAGKVLAEGQYRPIFAGEIEALYTLSKQWINTRYKRNNEQQKSAKAKTKDQHRVAA